MGVVLVLSGLLVMMTVVHSGPLCPNGPGCDLCEKLLASDSSFMTNCGGNFSPDMFASIEVDCGTYQKKEQFVHFLKNMHLICDQKKQPFDDPKCECSICELLLDPDSSFMVNCGKHLSDELLDSIRRDCATYEKNGEADQFLKNMHLICNEKGRTFDDPVCEECTYDLCVLMFFPTSDFMKKCGSLFSTEVLLTMFADCQEHKCDGWFEENIELNCKQKGAPPFNYPECGTDCSLFPFGEVHGDTLGPSCDDCVDTVTLDYPMNFLGSIYGTIYVCENGLFTFDVGSHMTSNEYCTWQAHRDVDTYGLLPFWADIYVARDSASRVWFRETRDPVILGKATSDVINTFDSACSSGFEAESVFVITWYLVRGYPDFYPYAWSFWWYEPYTYCYTYYSWWWPSDWYNYPQYYDPDNYEYEYCYTEYYPYQYYYYDWSDEANTFQAVVINGGSDDDLYVLFIYDQIEWIQTGWGIWPVVGISDGRGERIKWPPHDGYDAYALTSDSNIGHDGCYMYKISGSEPQDPQCNTP